MIPSGGNAMCPEVECSEGPDVKQCRLRLTRRSMGMGRVLQSCENVPFGEGDFRWAVPPHEMLSCRESATSPLSLSAASMVAEGTLGSSVLNATRRIVLPQGQWRRGSVPRTTGPVCRIMELLQRRADEREKLEEWRRENAWADRRAILRTHLKGVEVGNYQALPRMPMPRHEGTENAILCAASVVTHTICQEQRSEVT